MEELSVLKYLKRLVVFVLSFFSLHNGRSACISFSSSHCLSIVPVCKVVHQFVFVNQRINEVLDVFAISQICRIPRYRIPTHFPAQMLAPQTAVRACPLQHLEIAPVCRFRACPPVPRAFVCVRPLQHLEVSALCRLTTRLCVPRAAVRTRPLQHFELPVPCRTRARVLVPRTAVRACPRQHPRCPPHAAAEHVNLSHGALFARNNFNSSLCSLLAAARQRFS